MRRSGSPGRAAARYLRNRRQGQTGQDIAHGAVEDRSQRGRRDHVVDVVVAGSVAGADGAVTLAARSSHGVAAVARPGGRSRSRRRTGAPPELMPASRESA